MCCEKHRDTWIGEFLKDVFISAATGTHTIQATGKEHFGVN